VKENSADTVLKIATLKGLMQMVIVLFVKEFVFVPDVPEMKQLLYLK